MSEHLLSSIKITALKLLRKIQRPFKKIHRPLLINHLKKANLKSTKKIITKDGPVVSLTSFDKRIDIVYLAIESIARGRLLPGRITLWLEEELKANLPDSLKRLEKRGLEIQYTSDLGPHKKYYPEVTQNRDIDKSFVTADDDILYPKYWLERIVQSAEQLPNAIHCFRAREILFNDDGLIEPYSNWKHCNSAKCSHKHFSIGCYGVLFPAQMRKALKAQGLSFTQKCPRADDVWLNATAVKSGFPVKQVVSVPQHFYEIPTTRNTSLFDYNVREGGNDEQIAKTYTEQLIDKIKNAKP